MRATAGAFSSVSTKSLARRTKKRDLDRDEHADVD